MSWLAEAYPAKLAEVDPLMETAPEGGTIYKADGAYLAAMLRNDGQVSGGWTVLLVIAIVAAALFRPAKTLPIDPGQPPLLY